VYWLFEDRLRAFLWPQRLGFELTPVAREQVSLVDPVVAAPADGPPVKRTSAAVGLLRGDPGRAGFSALAEATRAYGLDLECAPPSGWTHLVAAAAENHWPLLGLVLEGLDELPEESGPALREYVWGGGTLLVSGILPGANETLARLCRDLAAGQPACQELIQPAGAIIFSGQEPGFAHELAGARVETTGARHHLSGVEGKVLASLQVGSDRRPAVLELALGQGRVVLAAGTESLAAHLGHAYGPASAPAVLPAMMLIRQLYGDTAWHVPAALACMVFDDPELSTGVLGTDYQLGLELACADDFHLAVATIPRWLGRSQAEVIQLLKEHPLRLSAAYHGNDHDGYEFFLHEGRRLRYRARPAAGQRRALEQAARRGREFARRTGYALDRVMVFPLGVAPPAAFRDLHELGFVASCNTQDRHPLGAPIPDDPDLGIRPADLAWEGFPLIWRRGLSDRTFALDLFGGRPVITYGHRKALGRHFEPFRERARQINELGRGRVRWRGLEEIARHCYMLRRDPAAGWQVLMAANEICLHNPDAGPRLYTVRRPLLPPGTSLKAEGTGASASVSVEVAVPAGATVHVSVSRLDGKDLPRGEQSCTITLD
jgi:hypothetical protein